MSTNQLDILAPFDDETQKELRILDVACQIQMSQFKREATRKKIAGEPLEMDTETMVWVQFIKGFGKLYNRAIDAGWIQDVYLDKLAETPEDENENAK